MSKNICFGNDIGQLTWRFANQYEKPLSFIRNEW